MPSQSIASGPDSPEPPSLAGRCTQASHDAAKETVRCWLEWSRHWPEHLPEWLKALADDDRRDLAAFLTTKRPWPGTTLLLWECRCNSTLAVCGDCRDEGMVEVGNGPGAKEVACDCQYDERGAA